jgi:hypothetical protein
MASRSQTRFDERLALHHPAGRPCLDVCTANGWAPESGDVVRLVRLWSEVREGRRSENDLSPARLEFARWLIEHGRLTETTGESLDAAA